MCSSSTVLVRHPIYWDKCLLNACLQNPCQRAPACSKTIRAAPIQPSTRQLEGLLFHQTCHYLGQDALQSSTWALPAYTSRNAVLGRACIIHLAGRRQPTRLKSLQLAYQRKAPHFSKSSLHRRQHQEEQEHAWNSDHTSLVRANAQMLRATHADVWALACSSLPTALLSRTSFPPLRGGKSTGEVAKTSTSAKLPWWCDPLSTGSAVQPAGRRWPGVLHLRSCAGPPGSPGQRVSYFGYVYALRPACAGLIRAKVDCCLFRRLTGR